MWKNILGQEKEEKKTSNLIMPLTQWRTFLDFFPTLIVLYYWLTVIRSKHKFHTHEKTLRERKAERKKRASTKYSNKSKATFFLNRWCITSVDNNNDINGNSSLARKRSFYNRLRFWLYVSKCSKSNSILCFMLFSCGDNNRHSIDESLRIDRKSTEWSFEIKSSKTSCRRSKRFRTICTSSSGCSTRYENNFHKNDISLNNDRRDIHSNEF